MNTVIRKATADDCGAIAVKADKRRNGAGRLLMKAAESWADSVGASGIRLNSGEMRSEAHSFYRSLGFVSDGKQLRFIKNQNNGEYNGTY